jgi:hypothetical protein
MDVSVPGELDGIRARFLELCSEFPGEFCRWLQMDSGPGAVRPPAGDD